MGYRVGASLPQLFITSTPVPMLIRKETGIQSRTFSTRRPMPIRRRDCARLDRGALGLKRKGSRSRRTVRNLQTNQTRRVMSQERNDWMSSCKMWCWLVIALLQVIHDDCWPNEKTCKVEQESPTLFQREGRFALQLHTVKIKFPEKNLCTSQFSVNFHVFSK